MTNDTAACCHVKAWLRSQKIEYSIFYFADERYTLEMDTAGERLTPRQKIALHYTRASSEELVVARFIVALKKAGVV